VLPDWHQPDVLLLQVSLQSGHVGQPGWLRVASELLNCLAAMAVAAKNCARNQRRLLDLLFPVEQGAQVDDALPLLAIATSVCEVWRTIPKPSGVAPKPSEPMEERHENNIQMVVEALLAAAEALAGLAAQAHQRSGEAGDPAVRERHRANIYKFLGLVMVTPGGLLLTAVQSTTADPTGAHTPIEANPYTAVRLSALSTTAAIFEDTGISALSLVSGYR
jgi:hypothetical protein